MARPQQQEIARTPGISPLDQNSREINAEQTLPEQKGRTGRIPAGNRPGRRPKKVQDKPAFATGDRIDLLHQKRGSEQVTFDDIADHMTDYLQSHPEDETVMHRFALFLARVEDDDHAHDEKPKSGSTADA